MTEDEILAGLQPLRPVMKYSSSIAVGNKPYSSWALGGIPAAGVYDTTLNGVVCDNTTVGAVDFQDPGSGVSRLTTWRGALTPAYAMYMLCDRLWHNGGITVTSTSSQSISSPTWPARDKNGSTNGAGVFLALEMSATVGNGNPTVTVTFTNSDGTASQTTNSNSTPALNNAPTGTFVILQHPAGCPGVRSVQSIQLSASLGSGTINLVAFRPLAMLQIPTSNGSNTMDAITAGMPTLFNGACLFFLANYYSGNSGSSMFNTLQWTRV